jgi:hypothetical protein
MWLIGTFESLCLRYQSETKDATHLRHGCTMIWSYFGFGHGKGMHDGASAVLNRKSEKNK